MAVNREPVGFDRGTHVGFDRVDGGQELRRRPLRVRGSTVRATGVRVVSRDARKGSRMRLRIVMRRVAVEVLGLIGIRCSNFRNSRESVGIIRVHRVSMR